MPKDSFESPVSQLSNDAFDIRNSYYDKKDLLISIHERNAMLSIRTDKKDLCPEIKTFWANAKAEK